MFILYCTNDLCSSIIIIIKPHTPPVSVFYNLNYRDDLFSAVKYGRKEESEKKRTKGRRKEEEVGRLNIIIKIDGGRRRRRKLSHIFFSSSLSFVVPSSS